MTARICGLRKEDILAAAEALSHAGVYEEDLIPPDEHPLDALEPGEPWILWESPTDPEQMYLSMYEPTTGWVTVRMSAIVRYVEREEDGYPGDIEYAANH